MKRRKLWIGTGSSAYSSGGPRFPGSSATKELTTDENGGFTFYGVGTADVALIAEHTSKGRSTTVRVPGSEESVFDVELVLLAPGALEGTVTVGGQPVENALVSAQSKTVPDARFAVSTGADGRYRFDLLAPDEYLVSASIHGGSPRNASFESASATVTSGATAEVNLEIEYGDAVLVVSARAASGLLQMARLYSASGSISAANEAELRARLAAREDGFSSRGFLFGERSARIEGLSPGDYTVCVVPFPSEVVGPAAHEYMERVGDELPAFCETTVVSPTPEEQRLVVTVEVPPYVPPPSD